MINSGWSNQQQDQTNISMIKGFIIVNLCHPLDKKNELEPTKMGSQHGLALITLLLATIFAYMEANSKIL